MSLLPLSLLKAAQRQPMLVELKNGDTYNGNLVGSDNFMNLALKDVTITSKDGQKFWSQPEVFVRGLAIKYIRVPEEVADLVVPTEQKPGEGAMGVSGGRGGWRGGRGTGDRGGGRGGRGGGDFRGGRGGGGYRGGGGGGDRGGRGGGSVYAGGGYGGGGARGGAGGGERGGRGGASAATSAPSAAK